MVCTITDPHTVHDSWMCTPHKFTDPNRCIADINAIYREYDSRLYSLIGPGLESATYMISHTHVTKTQHLIMNWSIRMMTHPHTHVTKPKAL